MELDSVDMPSLVAEMGVQYDPERLADELKKRPTEVGARAVFVSTRLSGFVAALLRDAASGGLESNMPKRARQLRDLLADLGPSFIKIGQALSSRPDLVPKVYLTELAELQDRLPPFSSRIAREVIREELGAPADEVFAELSEAPVAAASLGQVYRGRLHSGEEVAVKVQRPGIGDSIAVDMFLLRRIMKAVDRTLTPALGISQPLVPLVDEFADKLFKEMDYCAEGRNCEKFASLYCTGALPRVGTPGIYWEQTSRRVLTMEWIDGVKLTDEAGMRRLGLDVVDFVDVGIECTLRQLLEAGYFHADPHPGNLLATKSGKLVYLDFGMMSEAPQAARYALIAHVVHLVNRDYLAMTQDYYDLEFITRDVDTTPIAPALAAFFDDVLEDSVSKLNFRAIVDGLGEVLFQFPFQVPGYYALILRSLTVLEGLAISADEDYKLLARAYPYMAKRLLTDPSPQLRGSLEDLLVKEGRFRWGRLENLLREGSKSSDFDPDQLWLLAEWVFGDGDNRVRKPLAREAVRVLDALIADAWRQQAAAVYGPDAAERMLPHQPKERVDRERAQLIIDAVGGAGTGGGPAPPRGSGPMGTLTPPEVAKLLQDLQDQATAAFPRLSKVMRQQGAVDAANDVWVGLMSRGTARFVKLVNAGADPEVRDKVFQGLQATLAAGFVRGAPANPANPFGAGPFPGDAGGAGPPRSGAEQWGKAAGAGGCPPGAFPWSDGRGAWVGGVPPGAGFSGASGSWAVGGPAPPSAGDALSMAAHGLGLAAQAASVASAALGAIAVAAGEMEGGGSPWGGEERVWTGGDGGGDGGADEFSEP